MVNRLWGYEGEVCVSKLPEDLCLIEFASVRLSEWVLARSGTFINRHSLYVSGRSALVGWSWRLRRFRHGSNL
ncbi:hypothetical protein LINGRAHAP2_LOCUS10858 [Linum grandiflorum]